MKNRGRFYTILGLYLFLGIAWRMIYLVQFSQSPLFTFPCGPDVEEYDLRAREIIGGKILWDKTQIHAPLYPFTLATLYKITGFNHFAVRGMQLTLGFLAAIPLILLLLKENITNRRITAFFALIWLFYPPGIFYQAEYISESLCIVLITLSLFFLYFSDSRLGAGKKYPMPVAGLLCGLAVITHPLSALFPLFIVVHQILSYIFRNETKFIRNAVTFLIPVALCTVPVAIYNGTVVKSGFSIQANGGFNFFLGNNPDSDGTCYLRPGKKWDDSHRTAAAQAAAMGHGTDSYFIGKSAEFIVSHPLKWLGLTARKFLLNWNHRELNAGADSWKIRYFSEFQKVFSWTGGIVLVLALFGFLIVVKSGKTIYPYRYFILLLISFWLAQTIFVTSGRYRYPALPAFIIFCAFALDYLCTNIRRLNLIRHGRTFSERHQLGDIVPASCQRSSGNTISYMIKLFSYDLAVLAFAFLLVFMPSAGLSPAVDDAESDSILGEAYLKSGDLANAEDHILASSSVLGDWSRTWNLLGIIRQRKGNREDAEKYFLKAAAADPHDSNALMNLALISSDKGEIGKPDKLFAEALEITPDSPPLLFNYGFYLQKNNKLKEAEEAYRKCLEAYPSHRPALNNMGFIMMNKGDTASAEEYYTKALALDPKNPGIMANLAAAKFANGKKDEADILIKKTEKSK